MPHSLRDIVAYLDDYLRIGSLPDEPQALNGLQVESVGRVSRVGAAVDACQATIDLARSSSVDLLIVHHGLFWSGLEPVVGKHFKRLRTLLAHGIALYASHIPLDCHPTVGNNAVLAGRLGTTDLTPFGEYQGTSIGVAGSLDVERTELRERITRELGVAPRVIETGPARISRIGIVTGAGASALREARAAGIDTLLTGEGPHYTYLEAEELGLNLILAGHYATETVGVKALAAHLQDRFDLPWEFIDHPTGL